ncbi:MAG: hypothetical protein J6K89_01595 [Oscillospiraceae bacterium]|nr:hypothetical protein [Oscillospiraceae bacterium]
MKKNAGKKGQLPPVNPYNDILLKLFNARSELNFEREEKKLLQERLQEQLELCQGEIRRLKELEDQRIAGRRAAWIFAGKLGLMCLFAFGCTASAAACVSYGPWWSAIAPVVLLILGCYLAVCGRE